MKLDQKILARLDELIQMGERVTKNGRGNQFSKADVEDMLKYIRSFMETHFS